MTKPSENRIMEERDEVMVPPYSGSPTLRTAHFLKPSVSSIPPHPFSSSTTKTPLVEVSFNGWRYPQKDWKSWVDRMRPLHGEGWKKAGIYEALTGSTFTIPRNHNVVIGFAQRWCSHTKTFVFPWGEATVTLEDVMVLGGYPLLGTSVLSPLDNTQLNIEEKLIQARIQLTRTKARKATEAAWMSKFITSGSQIEHEAFLALWLSRFVFPTTAYDTVPKNVFPIAVRLATGTRIALAPAVLASIYRDLFVIKEAIDNSHKSGSRDGDDSHVTVSGPFQLFLVWIWERFPTLRPKPNLIQNGDPRLALWHNLKKLDVEDVGLVIDSAAEHFHWRPYALTVNTCLFFKFYKEKEGWVPVDSVLDEDSECFILCLRPSELVGLDSNIEQYLPHRVSMQFGMDQDLPGNVERYNTTPEIAWRYYKRPIAVAKLYFPPRLFEADVTTRYVSWWQQSFAGKSTMNSDGNKETCFNRRKITVEFSSKGKKADNDAFVPPNFPPKCSAVEERDSVDKDKLSVAELVRKGRTQNSKALIGDASQCSSLPAVDNKTLEKVQSVMKQVENTVNGEELENGSTDVTGIGGQSSALHTVEAQEMEFEARMSKLEKEVAQLKKEFE